MRYLFLLTLITTFIFAQTQIEEKAQTNRSLEIDKNLTTIKKTYTEPTNDENSKNWNTKDWESYLNNNGTDSSIVGSTQMNMQNLQGSEDAFNGNPNLMQSQTIKESDKYKDNKGLTSFSDDLLNNIVSSTLSHNSNKSLIDSSVKCYITRDIPLRYKCSFTGLLYGGSMESDGSMAKNQCENECYEQYQSVELVKEKSIPDLTMNDLTLKTSTEEGLSNYEINSEHTKSISNENVINTITFDYEVNENKRAYITIKHLDMNNVYSDIVKNVSLENKGSKTLVLNSLTKELTFILSAKEKSTELKITNIKFKINGGKYICPLQQDISKKNAGNFAYLCPSGKIKTFSHGYKSYTICEDYGVIGDNNDGTFSTQAAADAICKKNYQCTLDITFMNTAILQNFREGCIEGQPNCNQDTCKQLRLTDATILNENIFDGGLYPKQSIINQTQVQGVNRPRILLRTDLDFQTRTAEELKDEAYKNMIMNNKYVVSTVKLDENTQMSSAYNIGINGTSNLYSGSAKRALYWLLKPDAFSVNSTIKMYAIYDVIISKKIKNEFGKNEIVKDRIFYIQINKNDGLKAFARIDNYATNVANNLEDGNNLQNSLIETSQLSYKSFNTGTNSWFSHSGSLIAEYFNSEKLILEESPYKRIKLISEINNLVYLFPGIKRKIVSNGPIDTAIYNGDFDGSGETISKITVYTYYSVNNITYNQIIEKINSNEIKPIYDSLAFDKYAKDVTNDSNSKDYQVYLYGKQNEKTGFVRLFPKKEDIGKNGFIFIFAIEE